MFRERPRLRRLAAILFLAFGVLGTAFVTVTLTRDLALWIFGQRTVGRVTNAWIEPVGDVGQSGPAFRYYVSYRFATEDGQILTATSSVSAGEWVGLGMGGSVRAVYEEQRLVPLDTVGGLDEGQLVVVNYFPLYPSHNRLDDSRFIPVLACTYVPLAFLTYVVVAAGRQLLLPPGAGWL